MEISYDYDGDGSHPSRVVFSGPGADRQTTILFKDLRPLTWTEATEEPVPVNLRGLRPAVLPDADDGLPGWITQ